jgi:cytochrome c-type biogenesis protein CcmH/NrfF
VSDSARIDVRLPIGGLFTAIGVLLAGYGLATNGNAELYKPSLSVNINLWWGLAMLVFGVLMLVFAMRSRSKAPPPVVSPEALAIEQRERAVGLER